MKPGNRAGSIVQSSRSSCRVSCCDVIFSQLPCGDGNRENMVAPPQDVACPETLQSALLQSINKSSKVADALLHVWCLSALVDHWLNFLEKVTARFVWF